MGTTRHDWLEGERGEAGLANRALDLPGDCHLRTPDQLALRDVGVNNFENVGCVPRCRDLGCTLDQPKRFDQPLCRNELSAAWQECAQPFDQRVRHRTLKANARAARCELGQLFNRSPRDIAVKNFYVKQGAERLDGVLIAEIGHQHSSFSRQHDDAIRAGIARQVAHVDEVRNDQRVDFG